MYEQNHNILDLPNKSFAKHDQHNIHKGNLPAVIHIDSLMGYLNDTSKIVEGM
jgi:hypothetical protein